MSTRSNIAIVNNDGTVSAIYCHWDGYMEHNGKVLLSHYQKEKKVKRLIALGSISSLSHLVGGKKSPHKSFKNASNKYTLAYHRDRGEEKHITTYPNLEAYAKNTRSDVFIEYAYYFKDGKWFEVNYGELTPNNTKYAKE